MWFTPSDVYLEPEPLAAAYARAAARDGARVLDHTAVTGFLRSKGTIAGVETTAGRIAAGTVVLAAGGWLRALGRLAGLALPAQPVRHQLLITEPIAGVFALLAATEEPRQWCLLTLNPKEERRPLVAAKDRPELFETVVPPVWLGESSQCYGDWCGDPFGNSILWHASERPEGAQLRKGLRFHAVPARDALVLLVPADGKSVVALAPEEIR